MRTGTDRAMAVDSPSIQVGGERADPLAVASVSPWVESDGEFVVRFEPSTTVPADANLTVTIHQSLEPTSSTTLRDQVEEILDGGSAGRYLQGPLTTPLSELGDPRTGSVLTIPIRSQRSNSDRILLPNPGIHPVELVLTSAAGPELWREVVFINRLPDPERAADDEPDAEPVQVSLLLPVESGPAIAPDGSSSFSVEERSALGSAGSLLEAVPDAPLLIGTRPNTLDALQLDQEPWSQTLIDGLSEPAAGGGATNQLLPLPYADIDTGGIVAAGGADEVGRQLLIGAATTKTVTGRYPIFNTYAFDDSLTTQSLPVIRSVGVDSILAPLTSLQLTDGISEQDAMTRPMQLEGGEGMRILAYDTDISQRLADTATDPGVRAHQGVSLLMASWFSAQSEDEPVATASAILLSASTEPEVLEALQPSLTGSGPLRADPDGQALPPPPEGGAESSVALVPRTATDQRPALVATQETRRQIDAYRSMTGDADPSVPIWDDLNDESLATTLDDGEREALHASVRTAIAGNVAAIEPPRPRRVVVTSQDTVIPLRFSNGLPFDVKLVMRARSPRLEIPDGDSREIVLTPGENRIDLPVEVQAPGESLLRIELTSPDGGIQLASPEVPVRSTAISGVGAALSLISIVFLIAWWVHTHRRRRREEAKLGTAHPSGDTSPSSLEPGG